MKAFYLDTVTNNWLLVHNNNVAEKLAAGSCTLKVTADQTSVYIYQNNIRKGYAAITSLAKNAAGDKYANYSEFNTATANFFVDASAGTGASSDIGISPLYTTNGVDDGNGNITGTTRFVLPVNADISKDIWTFEGGILNMGFTKNVPLLAIDFTTAPLAGNGITIFYHKKITT